MAAPSSSSRPLWWRTVATLLLILVPVAAVVGVVLLAAYQPDIASDVFGGDGRPPDSPSNPFMLGGRDGTMWWPCADGGLVNYSYSVRDAGPIPVGVQAVEVLHDDYGGPAQLVSVMTNRSGARTPTPSWATPDLLMPFQPFTLGPNEIRTLAVRLRMVGCASGRSPGAYGLSPGLLRVTAFGFTHDVHVATAYDVAIVVGAGRS